MQVKVKEHHKISDLIRLYFIYRHTSLNKYVTSAEQRHAFNINKSNYEKSYAFFVNNISSLSIQESERNPIKGSIKSLNKKENEIKVAMHSNNSRVSIKRSTLQIIKANPLNTFNSTAIINQPQKRPKKFICLGGYRDIAQGLIKRGWIQNKDPKSVDFDYIWTLKTVDINYQILRKEQIAGHFSKNGAITRKSGLCKNIRNLIYRHMNPDNFFPRCYDLSDKNDLSDFIEDFKFTKAISILRTLLNNLKEDDEKNRVITTVTKDTLSEYTEEMIKMSIDIIERKIPIFFGEFELNNGAIKLVTDKEWNIISQEDNKGYIAFVDNIKRFDDIGFPQINIRSSSQLPKKLLALSNSSAASPNISGIMKINQKNNSNNDLIGNLQSVKNKSSNKKYYKNDLAKYLPIIQTLLEKLKKMPQYEMNGERNIWIMKPSCLSRGRGIVCTNKLNGILASIKENNQFIVQKYIENPMIILGRKFDIRQWVLVTNLNPLTIWLWESPYLRFGAEDYIIEDFSNLYAHLTNNSIGKYSQHFNNDKIEGNMWEISQFISYLQKKYQKDVWKELREKIIKIIICSFESARHEMKQRLNSHELFGYDLMIDVNLNAYLIEVNSSPAVDYSTKITEKLVKQMSEDLLKVVIDNNCQIDKETTIGNFQLIYTGKDINALSYTPNEFNSS